MDSHTQLYCSEKNITYNYMYAGFVVVTMSCSTAENDTTR